MSSAWAVRLGRQAERDFIDIMNWTAKSFGKAQANTYSETISLAIQALNHGPEILGSKLRDDIEPGIRSSTVTRASD